MTQHRRLFFLIILIVLADGCRKPPVENTTKTGTTDITSTDFGRKRRQGIDFTAHGTTPAWSLDIDFIKDIRFQVQNGPLLTAVVPKSQREPRGNGIMFDAQLNAEPSRQPKRPARRSVSADQNNGRLKVIISPVVCRNQSAQTYAYTVTIETNGKRYSGCGTFLNGLARLNTQWVLETYRGQRLHPEQFVNRQLPSLDINLKEKQLQGFTGCNTMQGHVKAEGDNIRFETISTTRRACPYNFESGFLTALQSVTLYRISNNRLTLLADGKYVMTFRKVVKKETGGVGK